MTTESFTETFKKNVNNAMKSFQDISTSMMDAQAKQMAFMNDMCTQSFNAFEGMSKGNTANSFTSPTNVIEIIKKNFESISNLSKSTLKTTLEFSKQAASSTISKQVIDNIIETYGKQADAVGAFNQKCVDLITKQMDTGKPFFNSTLMEKLKKDFDANIELSKEQLHLLIDSYSKLTNPSFESNKNFLNNISKQIDTMVDTNLKMWSDLMFSTPSTDSQYKNSESTTKSKDDAEPITTQGNFNKKGRTESKFQN